MMRAAHIALLTLCMLALALVGNTQPIGNTWYHFGQGGHDVQRDLQPTFDGGYIVTGMTGSLSSSSGSIYLLKLDSNLTQEWSRAIGGDNIDWGTSIRQLPDSGYAIAGYTNNHPPGGYEGYLVRTDKLGNVLWNRTYGGDDWDFFRSMDVMPDGGFVLVGETWSNSAGNTDVFIVRTNANGTELWRQTFGGTEADLAHEVLVTQDTGIVIVGETYSFGAGQRDALFMRYDLNGVQEFAQTIGWSGDDVLHGMAEYPNGELIMVGGSATETFGSMTFWYVQAQPDGVVLWTAPLGSDTPEDDWLVDVGLLGNSELYSTGLTKSFSTGDKPDIYGAHSTIGASYISSVSFGTLEGEEVGGMVVLPDNSVIFGSTTNGFDGSPGQRDVSLMRVEQPYHNNIDSTITQLDTLATQSMIVTVQPRPIEANAPALRGTGAAATLMLPAAWNRNSTVRIINLQGAVVQTQRITTGNNPLQLPNVASGIYVLEVTDSNGKFWHTKWLVD